MQTKEKHVWGYEGGNIKILPRERIKLKTKSKEKMNKTNISGCSFPPHTLYEVTVHSTMKHGHIKGNYS